MEHVGYPRCSRSVTPDVPAVIPECPRSVIPECPHSVIPDVPALSFPTFLIGNPVRGINDKAETLDSR